MILFGEDISSSSSMVHRFRRSLLSYGALPGGTDISRIKALTRFVAEHPELTQGLLYKVIKENPGLLLDPEVQDVIKQMLGFQHGGSGPDPRELADVFKVGDLEIRIWLRPMLITLRFNFTYCIMLTYATWKRTSILS